MLEGTVGYHKAILMVKILLILRRAFDCLLTSAASGCTRWRIGYDRCCKRPTALGATPASISTYPVAGAVSGVALILGATMQSRQTGGSSP